MLLLLLGCDSPEPAPGPPGVEPVAVPPDPPERWAVWPGDAPIADEADLAFFADYDVIEGELSVEGTSLRALTLPRLAEVGAVRIWENPGLDELDLTALTVVHGDLSLYDDPALTTLDGLGSLRSVGGQLALNRLLSLADADGLSALTDLGSLYVFHDPALTTLDGWTALTSIDGPAELFEDASLTGLSWPALEHIGGRLHLWSDPALAELELPSLTSLYGLELHHVDALRSLDGLEGVTELPGGLELLYQPELASLDGLSGVRSLGRLRVEGLTSLASLGLPALTDAGAVKVTWNDALTDPGLAALRSADELVFEHDPSLPDCAVGALFAAVDAPLETCAHLAEAGCPEACDP